ncbi:MAG: phosphatidate cytidylyltransferase [Gammaproteobacteria bacterium]|nr:phosphatidate cytidylyltransferase [Gammaproteobacteria bacterium]
MLLRSVTALVLAPAVVGLTLYLPTHWYSLVLLLPVLLGMAEWNRLTVRSPRALAVSAPAMGLVAVWLSGFPVALWGICLAASGLWLYCLFALCRNRMAGIPGSTAGFLSGWYCLLAAWAGLVLLHQQPLQGPAVATAVLAVVWAADTFAYLVGKGIGKRKLVPDLSPNKTVEGLAGGLLGAGMTAWGLSAYWLQFPATTHRSWMVAGLLAAVASVVGDLFQSRLKRVAGLKNSGNLLPGHGGVLDRIDGIIAAVPVFAVLWVGLP